MSKKPQNSRKKKRSKKMAIARVNSEVLAIDNDNVPADHRYDKEIADVCSSLLIKSQLARLERPTSIDNLIKKELLLIINQRKISRVASAFFNNILLVSKKQPLIPAAHKILKATYEEYVVVEKHLALLSHITMRNRIESLFNKLIECKWEVVRYMEDDFEVPDSPGNVIILRKGWENKFDEHGELNSSLPIAAITTDMNTLTEISYQEGILLYRQTASSSHYLLKIYPANNIPGIPLSPPSIQIDE